MAHETVPADIAAAISRFDAAAQAWGWEADMGTGADTAEVMAEYDAARAALDGAVLKHLRGVDEMKAALEAQTSGGA